MAARAASPPTRPRVGARPLPGRSDFFLPFQFTAGTRDGGTTISLTGRAPAGAQPVAPGAGDIRALSFSDSAEVTGSVVFAGYGIVVPEAQSFGYDSYATLDVKDKIVLVNLSGRGDKDVQQVQKLLTPGA